MIISASVKTIFTEMFEFGHGIPDYINVLGTQRKTGDIKDTGEWYHTYRVTGYSDELEAPYRANVKIHLSRVNGGYATVEEVDLSEFDRIAEIIETYPGDYAFTVPVSVETPRFDG